jgi:hypothetical protein
MRNKNIDVPRGNRAAQPAMAIKTMRQAARSNARYPRSQQVAAPIQSFSGPDEIRTGLHFLF